MRYAAAKDVVRKLEVYGSSASVGLRQLGGFHALLGGDPAISYKQ